MTKIELNPSIEENPYRRYMHAVMTVVAGAIGFTVCSFFLHRIHPEAGMTPLLNIRGYPLTAVSLLAGLEMIFLIIMIGVLTLFYRRADRRRLKQLEEYSARLKQELSRQKQRETRLEHAVKDLERFNAMAMGREQRILELKSEINTLLQKQGQPKRYSAAPAE